MPKRKITDEEFDRILCGIIGDLSAETIIGIPGIYEVLAEHFNNEVLEQWKEE